MPTSRPEPVAPPGRNPEAIRSPSHGAGAGNPQPTATRSYTLPRITIPRTLLAATIAAATTLGIVASASSSGSSRPAGKVHVLQVHRDAGHDFIIDADHSATPAK